MTTENSVGAAPDATMDWQAINWRQVHQNVRRLQIRIVKGLLARLCRAPWSNRELQCSHLPSKYFTDFKKSSVSVGSSQ
jgi:hypothetical protein